MSAAVLRARRRRATAVLALVLACLLGAPGTASAAIAFVAATSAGNGAGATTLAVTKPTGTTVDDVLVATVVATGTTAITQPSGWTVARDTTLSGARMVTAYHVAGGSEGSSYTWTLGSSRTASAGISDYSGVNVTVPVEATGSSTGASGNAVAPSVTTATTNTMVISAVGIQRATTITASSGTTERFDVASNATTTDVADAAQATAGASTARTAVPAVTTSPWGAQTIALRDAANAALTVGATTPTAFSASLNSGDTTGSYTLPLTVTDTRVGGTASLGWNLTITSTLFSNAGGKTLAANASSLTAATATCLNGGVCRAATNAATLPVTVPAAATAPAAVKFCSIAATAGIGLFSVSAPVTLTIPQNGYSGSFTSTVTISIVSGP